MPRRRLDEVLGGASASKSKQRHLYLVLDDWSSGYSIREIDLSADLDPFNDGPARHQFAKRRRRLPPAILRFEAQRELPRCFAASFGSILAMLPVCVDPAPGGLAFNVHGRTAGYLPLQAPNPAHPVYIPVDDCGLFSLADDSFELLRNEEEEQHRDDDDDSSLCCGCQEQQPEPSWKLVWRKLPDLPPPFHSADVTAYAVHGGDHSLFVSTRDGSTFVCYTVGLHQMNGTNGANNGFLEWQRHARRHGQRWVLPFAGRGHFDSELQAWVGFSRELAGHLCACEAFPAFVGHCPDGGDGEVEQQAPAVRISKEELFVVNPHEKLVGATLVSCGVRSYYCLVQCICVDEKQSMSDDGKLEEQSASLLRVLTFYVDYDKNGDLCVGDRQIRDYILPDSVSEEVRKNPVAFWI